MLQPVHDRSLVAQAIAMFADAPRTADDIRAEHDRELAAMTPAQLAVVCRERQAAKASCMCTGTSDQLLDRICRAEAQLRTVAGGQ